MNYFLAKTEPTTYSIDDLAREGKTLWDGVHNNEAILHIKTMKPGDTVYIYHSMSDKKIVGVATVVSDPFLNTADPRHSWAVYMQFVKRVDGPTLKDCKSSAECEGFKLVTHSRLSVMPVPARAVEWINSHIIE